MAIFSKFFGNVMSHIIRSKAGKKINTISELFIKQKIVFNYVYFSSSQTLVADLCYVALFEDVSFLKLNFMLNFYLMKDLT